MYTECIKQSISNSDYSCVSLISDILQYFDKEKTDMVWEAS